MQILAFALYFLVVLAIGIWFFIKTKGSGDKEYFLGGRSTGPWVTAMSAQASDMSGWLLMGFPGAILAAGLGEVWIGIGLALGTILNWIIVAKRLRKFSEASGDSITLPQYLTNRFATSNPALKITCAVIFLIAFTVYVASAFVAGTKVFVSVCPALEGRELLAMMIFAALILCYTFLGGYKAVCWTDFFQGLMMLGALLLVPIFMCYMGDVLPDLFNKIQLDPVVDGAGKIIKPEVKIAAFGQNLFPPHVSWGSIISGLGWGLGYFGMPHIIVRFMGIKSASEVKKSAWIACVWVVLSLGAAIAIAILGRVFLFQGESINKIIENAPKAAVVADAVQENTADGEATKETVALEGASDELKNAVRDRSLAVDLVPAGKSEMIFVRIVNDLFPTFLAGLLLAAIIAASMSTADSQLLVASSAFSSDFYQPIVRKNKATDAEMLWVGRFVVVIVAFVAFYIAASGIEYEKEVAAEKEAAALKAEMAAETAANEKTVSTVAETNETVSAVSKVTTATSSVNGTNETAIAVTEAAAETIANETAAVETVAPEKTDTDAKPLVKPVEKSGSWAASIMKLVSNAWGLFGASFGAVIILSLFWRRFNYAGALAGIIAGAVVDIFWLTVEFAFHDPEMIKKALESTDPTVVANAKAGFVMASLTTGTGIYEIVPGFAACLVIAVIVTLVTRKPGAEVDAIFDKATAR